MEPDFSHCRRHLDPIELDIGPVPLVFIPHIESELDVDETVKADVHIVASGNGPDFHLAVHWDSSNGFSSEHSSKPADMSGTASFEGDATAHAKLPTTLRLLLYDVGGVEARLTPQLSARLQTPGKPLWTLDGRFVGEIESRRNCRSSVTSGGTIKRSSMRVFTWLRRRTIPPSHLSPRAGSGADGERRASRQLDGLHRAVASDQEDGELCCTFRWSLPENAARIGKRNLVHLPPPGPLRISWSPRPTAMGRHESRNLSESTSSHIRRARGFSCPPGCALPVSTSDTRCAFGGRTLGSGSETCRSIADLAAPR